MDEIAHHHADLGDVRLHYVTVGEGFPVVLLHGWPQSWYEWRHIMPGLAAAKYQVIAPDLRGLGDSSRPLTGYDKKTVGDDIWRLLQRLNIDEFYLVGHDWGGPTAYAIAAAHPDCRAQTGNPGRDHSRRRQPKHQPGRPPLASCVPPDPRSAGGADYRPRRTSISAGSTAITGIGPTLFRTPTSPSICASTANRARCGLAWATTGRSLRTSPTTRPSAATFKLPMPVLALGGDSSWGRRMEVVELLRRMAIDVRGGILENCGHWMPEEQPAALLEQLLAFFA